MNISGNKKVTSWLLVVMISLVLTRVWSVSLYYIFGSDSEMTQRIINDPWHHYHVGLVLLVLAFLLRKRTKSFALAAVGLGIILEEWPVVLNDFGFNTLNMYHTKVDFLVVFFVVGTIYLLLNRLVVNRNE